MVVILAAVVFGVCLATNIYNINSANDNKRK